MELDDVQKLDPLGNNDAIYEGEEGKEKTGRGRCSRFAYHFSGGSIDTIRLTSLNTAEVCVLWARPSHECHMIHTQTTPLPHLSTQGLFLKDWWEFHLMQRLWQGERGSEE